MRKRNKKKRWGEGWKEKEECGCWWANDDPRRALNKSQDDERHIKKIWKREKDVSKTSRIVISWWWVLIAHNYYNKHVRLGYSCLTEFIMIIIIFRLLFHVYHDSLSLFTYCDTPSLSLSLTHSLSWPNGQTFVFYDGLQTWGMPVATPNTGTSLVCVLRKTV